MRRIRSHALDKCVDGGAIHRVAINNDAGRDAGAIQSDRDAGADAGAIQRDAGAIQSDLLGPSADAGAIQIDLAQGF